MSLSGTHSKRPPADCQPQVPPRKKPLNFTTEACIRWNRGNCYSTSCRWSHKCLVYRLPHTPLRLAPFCSPPQQLASSFLLRVLAAPSCRMGTTSGVLLPSCTCPSGTPGPVLCCRIGFLLNTNHRTPSLYQTFVVSSTIAYLVFIMLALFCQSFILLCRGPGIMS